MRGRFWVPAAALLALGLVFYFAVYGFRFAGVLLFLAAGVVLAFGIVDALRGRFPRFSRWAARIGLILVCLGLVLAAGTAGWVVSAGHGADDPEAQWVVVLGAGVNGTVPSQALRERLEAAQDYLARYPEAVAVLSGAQGDGESITEARCMYDWLTARGVDPARLRLETKATTTEENLRCSTSSRPRPARARPRLPSSQENITCCAPSCWPAGPGLKHWASRRTRTTARFTASCWRGRSAASGSRSYSREALNQSFPN